MWLVQQCKFVPGLTAVHLMHARHGSASESVHFPGFRHCEHECITVVTIVLPWPLDVSSVRRLQPPSSAGRPNGGCSCPYRGSWGSAWGHILWWWLCYIMCYILSQSESLCVLPQAPSAAGGFRPTTILSSLYGNLASFVCGLKGACACHKQNHPVQG